jgi:DNA-binding NtrC family response regulator
MIRLLLYSDSKLQDVLAATLGSGYSVLVESSKDKVKRLLTGEQVDVLIVDLDSTNSALAEQLAFLAEIKGPSVPIVVMTDDDRRSTAMELVGRGVYDYFRKPPSIVDLKFVVGRAHEHAKLKRELEQARDKLRRAGTCDQLIGASGRAQVVYDLIRRVSDLTATVLITGESGTGKELVARAIHNLGHRAKLPFVAISCGAIPESLIEAELFGHEKGAFTGAAGARVGYMEQAGEGTLFLDEIGELSLHTQVKLLRVLQQKEFFRLGGSRAIPLKARILFATHRSLPHMVHEGTFRQDLFFRVNVLKIEVPSLQERVEDIPLLANYFVTMYAATYGKVVHEIDAGAMELLLDYDWPGNIRELENAIQSAVVLCEGETIHAQDLPKTLQRSSLAAMDLDTGVESQSFEERLRDYKIKLATQAIVECNGNKTNAARRLHISRAYLHRLVRSGAEGLEGAEVA